MYITLLMQTVDTLRNVQTYVDPTDGASMHRMLTWLQHAKRNENHLLYRVVTQKSAHLVYVQSDTPLDTSNIERYGFVSKGCVNLTFDAGRNIQFSMRVHPTVAHSGRPEYLHEAKERMEWCKRKLSDSGLAIHQMIETGTNVVRFKKNQPKGTIIECCDIAGLATITDPQRFEQFVQHGVGKLKNYGAGMFIFN